MMEKRASFSNLSMVVADMEEMKLREKRRRRRIISLGKEGDRSNSIIEESEEVLGDRRKEEKRRISVFVS